MSTHNLVAADTHRYLTIRYLFALALIAAAMLAHQAVREMHHRYHMAFSHSLEQATTQLLLVQRSIIVAGFWMDSDSDAEASRARAEFEHAVQRLQASAASAASAVLPAAYRAQLQEYIEHLGHLLSIPPSQYGPEEEHYLDLKMRIEGPWMDEIRALVQQYERYGTQRLDRLMDIERALLMLSLGLVVLLGLFVFRPMVRQVMRAQAYLEHLSRLKSEFLANMSHEIRTPINAIFGIGELLLQSDITPKQRGQVETLMGSADGLLSVIDDILDFSKIEAGRLEIEAVPFDLHSAAEDVAELLAARAREKRLEVIVRYMPGTPQFLVGDPGRVRQVLINMVGNAIKFTDAGYVMITVEAVDGEMPEGDEVMIRVKVEDTGIGIERGKLAHIFDMFAQADGSTTRRYGGTGLGLTISRQLSMLMGGNVGVESEEGKGSIFWFTLRMKRVDRPGRFEPSHGVLVGMRVLVVDDIEANRELLLDSLPREGMTVMAVDGAKKALRELRSAADASHPYDLALVDYMMPEMNGDTLVRSIRNDPAISHTPIIVLSSAEEKGFLKTFSSMGVAAYLSKPARRAQLLDVMAMVLEAKARGQEFEMLTTHATEAKRARAVFEQSQPLKGIHILLTEDNRINREFTTEMLESMGARVDHAENGQVAVAKCGQQHYDIILMDCQMPVMDGFEAAKTLQAMKARGELSDIPIIALTANAMEGDRERCLRSGMHDYLSKPVRRSNLEAMLLRWLKNIQAPPAVAIAATAPPVVATAAAEGIDLQAFAETHELVGEKLATIIDYYCEDGAQYLSEIRRCVEDGQPMGQCVAPAHSLKSSSRQFGLNAVSGFARQIEEITRGSGSDGDMRSQVAALVEPLTLAMAQGQAFLQQARAEGL